MKSIIATFPFVAILAAVPFSVAQAQSASEEDKRALVANFLEADSNSDGLLYGSEFELLMKLNAEDNLGRAAKVVNSGAYTMIFKRLDKNSDGAVSVEEIQAMTEERG